MRGAAARRAIEALAFLGQLLTDEDDFERVLDGYLEARGVLADAFQEMATNRFPAASDQLSATISRVEARIRERAGAGAPASHVAVRGLRGIRGILLAYLMAHPGKPVPASRLRILTGDQVHTERRLRELRDLGYTVLAERVSDQDCYILTSVQQNLDAAAELQFERNLNADKQLPEAERQLLLARFREHRTSTV